MYCRKMGVPYIHKNIYFLTSKCKASKEQKNLLSFF